MIVLAATRICNNMNQSKRISINLLKRLILFFSEMVSNLLKVNCTFFKPSKERCIVKYCSIHYLHIRNYFYVFWKWKLYDFDDGLEKCYSSNYKYSYCCVSGFTHLIFFVFEGPHPQFSEQKMRILTLNFQNKKRKMLFSSNYKYSYCCVSGFTHLIFFVFEGPHPQFSEQKLRILTLNFQKKKRGSPPSIFRTKNEGPHPQFSEQKLRVPTLSFQKKKWGSQPSIFSTKTEDSPSKWTLQKWGSPPSVFSFLTLAVTKASCTNWIVTSYR